MKLNERRKRWPFNTGNFLIEVTTLAGLTVLQHIKIPSEVGCFNVNSLGGQKTVYYIIKKK
jgi:hypothetical protein